MILSDLEREIIVIVARAMEPMTVGEIVWRLLKDEVIHWAGPAHDSIRKLRDKGLLLRIAMNRRGIVVYGNVLSPEGFLVSIELLREKTREEKRRD